MKRIGLGLAAALLTLGMTACGDDEKSAAGGGDYCTVAGEVASLQSQLDLQMNGTEPPAPADFEALITQFVGQVNKLDAAAPAEIDADMATIKTAYAAFDSAMATVDYDFSKLFDPAAAAAIQEQIAVLQADETQAALDRVADYTETTCGIQLGDS